jgi:histidine ammonia-lyase
MIQLTGESLNIDQVWDIAHNKTKVALSDSSKKLMEKSRKYILDKLKSVGAIYGVNTGFGALSSVKISDDKLIELQKNLIRSHCCGIGQPFTIPETRAIMALRANALARGHSGIRPDVVEKILEFLNADVIPVIPQQGSVGASGDLAPLSHLALAIIGEGEVWGSDKKNIKPLELQAKEGLSMINGCQVMTAVGLLNLYRARRLSWITDLAGAMTLEAMQGTRSAFDPLISATRPHPGEAITAKNLLMLMGPSSEISESHKDCSRVQDAYSLRCMPQVHGAAKDAFRNAIKTLEIEANSSTDNPLVFDDEDQILSCGNFHGEPVAFQMDFAAIAMTAMSSISECRIEKLINPAMSGLPAFLTKDSGLNSGHMIVQVAAASLVSENKILSHPASVDSIPTSADKEDHVSMGTIAARKFGQILDNAENVVAMELLSGSQALDLLKPLKPAASVKACYDVIRKKVPYAEKDRVFAKDIQAIREMINDGSLLKTMEATSGRLEF